VRLDLETQTVESDGSQSIGVTYADTDIVVWDCPRCGQANAEELLNA
jgi:predicted RNA-binding Zn-ribbon protein involved in translation (DUF1610 family)